MMRKKVLIFLGAAFLFFALFATSNADLLLLGNGVINKSANPDDIGGSFNLVYDSDLDITWFDYSVYPAIENWNDVLAWVEHLVVTDALSGKIYDNWRLPRAVDGPHTPEFVGYNVTSSEMGHLYYVELGNIGRKDILGNDQLGYGLKNTGPFDDLVEGWNYLTGTDFTQYPFLEGVFNFNFEDGHQGLSTKTYGGHVIVVQDGGASVPIPGAIWLLESGLAGLVVTRLKRKSD